MSAPIALVLDPMHVRAYVADSNEPALDASWDANAPAEVVRRLRDVAGPSSRVVMIVGMGFLEIARPELPPMADDARQALLQRDADRYFPIEGSVATTWRDGLAFAMSAALLGEWARAFAALGPIDAIVALPTACADAGMSGTFVASYATELAEGEHGVVELRDGVLRDARRVGGLRGTTNGTVLDAAQIARAILRGGADSLSSQLLDTTLTRQLYRRQRHRLWRSVATLAAAVVLLAWSADRWRERTVLALEQQVRTLSGAAAASRQALARLERAATERTLLASADSATRSGTSAAQILARLGALLPADAFVQRLEWDGTAWRIDGSATDAPRIVPLLDSDARFTDVRAVAASTRFLDAGKQRESFSIAFRTRAPGRSSNAGR
jgi:hypothetical protein